MHSKRRRPRIVTSPFRTRDAPMRLAPALPPPRFIRVLDFRAFRERERRRSHGIRFSGHGLTLREAGMRWVHELAKVDGFCLAWQHSRRATTFEPSLGLLPVFCKVNF